MSKKLQEYTKKRTLTTSPEPPAKVKKSQTGNLFVVQQHHASHMHYDLRLEVDGVLASWAVPKGPSLNPTEKRLAVQTEDHPVEYAHFEGIIPEGYGAGTVLIWDTGTYENVTEKEGVCLSPSQALEHGYIKVMLKGKKLRGLYTLQRFDGTKWLFTKVQDKYADAHEQITETQPRSVVSKDTSETLDVRYKKIKK